MNRFLAVLLASQIACATTTQVRLSPQQLDELLVANTNHRERATLSPGNGTPKTVDLVDNRDSWVHLQIDGPRVPNVRLRELSLVSEPDRMVRALWPGDSPKLRYLVELSQVRSATLGLADAGGTTAEARSNTGIIALGLVVVASVLVGLGASIANTNWAGYTYSSNSSGGGFAGLHAGPPR